MRKLVLGVTFSTMVLGAGCSSTQSSEPALAPATDAGNEEYIDPVAVSPDVYSVLHEDDHVRILNMQLAVGANDNKHSHPYEAVYFVKGGKGQITLPNGEQMEKEIPDGGVMTHPGWTHTVKNIGESDIHAIIVELKEKPESAGAVGDELDPTKVAPEVYKVLSEDERVRIVEMTLKAGEEDAI